jgi:hypothetical protein
MKKFLLIILILLAPATAAFSKLDLGLKAGYNASKLSTDNSEISSSFRSGFVFGAFARIGERFFLQPELLYSQNGGEFSSTIQVQGQQANIVSDFKQSSFDLCLLAGYHIIDTETLKVNGQAGLVASIMTDKGAWNLDPVMTTDFQNVNWALKFGAGVDFSNLSLDVRYLLGLNNVNSTSQLEMKNSRVEVTLGLKILSF